MIYAILKLYARIAIKIYCPRIIIDKPEWLHAKGPILLACNHPNSFLDGAIITTLFDHAVYSLARGDAFINPTANKILRKLRLLPVYRTSEGVENLEHNYTTFAACQQVFREDQIVLIFSEGLCENEWHLRPLKKGTARLAISSWMQDIPLTVVPTGINYSSFKKYGKGIHLKFGEAINSANILLEETEGKKLLAFNQQLKAQLEQLVYEINPIDQKKRKTIFGIHTNAKTLMLAIPAMAGILAHAPFFFLAKLFSHRFWNTGHYDSVLHSILLLFYPLYLLVVIFLLFSFIGFWSLIAILILPLLAWCATQVKYDLDI